MGQTVAYRDLTSGGHASSFDIDSGTGQIKTVSWGTYNYEATKNSYSVTASDGTASATIDVTITVTDADEQPDQPAKPTVSAVSGSTTSLTATWTEPGLNGGPEITGYGVGYREGTSGAWTGWTHTGTGIATTITGRTAGMEHQVRVRAKNGELDSAWSASGSGSTNAAPPLTDAPGDEGDLRLADEEPYRHPDGHEGVAGRAEIFHPGRWGTVCSDGFSRSTLTIVIQEVDAAGDPEVDSDGNKVHTETEYDNNAPALFCQSKGYDTGEYAPGWGQPGVESQSSGLGSYYPVGSTYPAGGPQPIWVDDMTCVTGDADLTVDALPAPMTHCGYAGWGMHNCSHSEDAGVRCWNEMDSAPAGVAEPLTAAFEGMPEAHDGDDYAAAAGTLKFAPGERSKTVAVTVLDDSVDRDGETFRVLLSNASGARLADGEGIGTIHNADPLPRAWLARFGRTAADHAVDAIAERFDGPGGGDSHATFAGCRLWNGGGRAGADDDPFAPGGLFGPAPGDPFEAPGGGLGGSSRFDLGSGGGGSGRSFGTGAGVKAGITGGTAAEARPARRGRLPPDPARPADTQFVPAVGRRRRRLAAADRLGRNCGGALQRRVGRRLGRRRGGDVPGRRGRGLEAVAGGDLGGPLARRRRVPRCARDRGRTRQHPDGGASVPALPGHRPAVRVGRARLRRGGSKPRDGRLDVAHGHVHADGRGRRARGVPARRRRPGAGATWRRTRTTPTGNGARAPRSGWIPARRDAG